MKNRKNMMKGFSLVELIVVLMIIAILSAIVGLAWNNWIYRTRISSANSRAKVIFNAAQTEAIKYSQAERLDPAHGYLSNGDYYFYWNGTTGGFSRTDSQNATAFTTGTGKEQANTRKFQTAINRIAGTDGCYKVWIRNYIVQSVTYVPNTNSNYLGAFPKQQSEPSTIALTPRSLHTDMTDFT